MWQYAEFQSHREIIQEISAQSEQVLAHFLFSTVLINNLKNFSKIFTDVFQSADIPQTQNTVQDTGLQYVRQK